VRTLAAAVLVGLLGGRLSAAEAADGPALPDPLVLRKLATPRVCLVRADGPLGLPEAYATGFLIGAGKFVITDLATVARPGVTRVVVRFEDGTALAAEGWGMADPTVGLVALALPEVRRDPGGLTLSTAAPAGDDGLPVLLVGYAYAESISVVTGRLLEAVPVGEVAEALKVGAALPEGAGAFRRLQAPAWPIVTGAPVLDAGGGVVAVLLRLRGRDDLLAVPADALRRALLEAEPSLKPLDRLPKPLWPVALKRVAGQPPTPQALAGAVRAIRSGSRCYKCRGKGRVLVRKVVGRRRVGGIVKDIVREAPEPCDACRGRGIVFRPTLYKFYQQVAAAATGLAADPATKPEVLEAAVANTVGLLAALREVHPAYREGLARAAAADLAHARAPLPRGVLVYAQRLEEVREKGRELVLLKPYHSKVHLVVPREALERPLGAPPRKKSPVPKPGDWVILAGLARGRISVDGRSALYVEPFGWGWSPVLGPAPRYLVDSGQVPSERPASPPPPRSGRNDGVPDFFGL